MATGEFAGINPEAWKIVDGKLYLGWSKKGLEKFNEDPTANIEKADRNWDKMTGQN